MSTTRAIPLTTTSSHRKELREHAERLWQLYLSALAVDAKFAAGLKAESDRAYDLHLAYCQLETRVETERFQNELAHARALSKTY